MGVILGANGRPASKDDELVDQLDDRPLQTDPALDNLPVLRFYDCINAYCWSQSTLKRPTLNSMFRAIMRPGGRAAFSDHEARDLAHTISSLAFACEPPQGRELMALIFGGAIADEPQRYVDFTEALAKHLKATCPAADKRALDQLDKVADFVTANLYREARNQEAFPRARLADALGIKRQSLKDGGWLTVIGYAKDACYFWMEQAKDDLTVKLRLRGVVV